MSDDGSSNNVPARDVARGLLTGVSDLLGGDPELAGREFDRVMDRLGKEDVTEEVAEGYAIGESVNDIRRRMRQQQGPSVTWREIEDDGEFVGLRVFVSEPPSQVQVFVSTDQVLISTSAGAVVQPLRFRPDPDVEWVSPRGGSISELVIRPVGYAEDEPEEEEPKALPPGDEDEDPDSDEPD